MKQRTAGAVLGCVGMLVLILDARTALSGAKAGVELCLWTLIPALFPFFAAANLLSAGLSPRFLRPLAKALGIPQGAEGLLLAGILGGYPVGAQCIAAQVEAGTLRPEDARRMLGFCSNAGPAFLFGVVGQQLSHMGLALALWLIHLGSALVVGLLLPRNPNPGSVSCRSRKTDVMGTAVRAMAMVCGWVILLRIVIAVLERWVGWLLPQPWHTAAVGLLELTNGCCQLRAIANPGVRFVLCAGMLGFGGLCVLLQTRSVTVFCGLGEYFPGKVLQTALSLPAAFLVQRFLLPEGQRMPFSPLLLLPIATFFAGILLLRKKGVEKPAPMVYTGGRLSREVS